MRQDRNHSRKLDVPRLIIGPVLVLSLCLAAGHALGAEEGLARMRPASQPKVSSSAKSDLYDVEANGVDIKLVLEALARRANVNIVVGPEVAGDTNARLLQMPVDAILDALSTAQGFKWEKNGAAYVVGTKQQIEKPPAPAPVEAPETTVAVVECKNIKTSDAIDILTKLFPDVKSVDGPDSVSPAFSANTGGTAAASSSSYGGGTATSSTAKVESNATRIVLMGVTDQVEKAKEVLKGLDVARRQVHLQVEITEITASDSTDLGITWTWSDIMLTEDNNSGIGFGKFTKEGMSITGTLSALIKNGKASLLAQPNISVLDSENAHILIGEKILYPKLVGYNQIGSPIYDKEEQEVGIRLDIAPKITSDNKVLLSLYPQVSLVTSYLKTQAGDYPQISTREACTTVSVKDGTTLAIGGLLRNTDIVNASKIPLLGDLPILGQFFRQSKKTAERTEIVIFVTPTIVDAGEPPQGERNAD